MDINSIKKQLELIENKRILVIGDLMIDHYIWGKVDRISQEAPVPVINVSREEYRLGGAANVVYNLRALKAEPFVVGVVGNDRYGVKLKELFAENGIENTFLIVDSSRPTTLKSRIIAQNQQVARIDFEETNDISEKISNDIFNQIELVIDKIDAVILEDYNKGLLTTNLIQKIINLSKIKNKIITVDPKFKNFFAYKNCSVFKPNYLELQKNMGVSIENETEYYQVAYQLLEKIEAEYLIITRGEKGLSIFSKNSEEINLPTYAQEVFDVSGAGDTVISTLTLCLSSDCDIKTSAIIANHAAGSVCGKVGINPARKKDILKSFKNQSKKEHFGS